MTTLKRGYSYIEEDDSNYQQEVVFLGKETEGNIFYYVQGNYVATGYNNVEKYYTLLDDKKLKVVAKKVDEWIFYIVQNNRGIVISAGCNIFNSIREARTHWSNKKNGHHWGLITFGADEVAKDRIKRNNRRLKAAEDMYAKYKELEA